MLDCCRLIIIFVKLSSSLLINKMLLRIYFFSDLTGSD